MRKLITEARWLLESARAALAAEAGVDPAEADVAARLRLTGYPAALAQFYAAAPRLLDAFIARAQAHDGGHRPHATYHVLLNETHLLCEDLPYEVDKAPHTVRLLRQPGSGELVGIALPGRWDVPER